MMRYKPETPIYAFFPEESNRAFTADNVQEMEAFSTIVLSTFGKSPYPDLAVEIAGLNNAIEYAQALANHFEQNIEIHSCYGENYETTVFPHQNQNSS